MVTLWCESEGGWQELEPCFPPTVLFYPHAIKGSPWNGMSRALLLIFAKCRTDHIRLNSNCWVFRTQLALQSIWKDVSGSQTLVGVLAMYLRTPIPREGYDHGRERLHWYRICSGSERHLWEDHIQFTTEITTTQLQPGLTGPLQLNVQRRRE